MMWRLMGFIGSHFQGFLQHLGQFGIMVFDILRLLPRISDYRERTVAEMVEIGMRSLPVVLIISLFAGMVTSVQTAYQFQNYIPLYLVGSVVGQSVLLELAPVLTGLVLTGRVGATIAAQIGTMKVTEQIDALQVMALEPILYLVIPRLVAGLIMFPVLVILADTIAILAGLLISIISMDLSTTSFFYGMKLFFRTWDAIYGLIKSVFFGLTITLVACYEGMNVEVGSGAEGVGKATTNTVVVSCLLILMLDYFLAKTLL